MHDEGEKLSMSPFFFFFFLSGTVASAAVFDFVVEEVVVVVVVEVEAGALARILTRRGGSNMRR